MISLKMNSKGEYVNALGIRVRASSFYSPGSEKLFKLSRGRFADFLSCPRCFYLDRVKGLESPTTPPWSLNSNTDRLLKKEFDICREAQVPHRLFANNGLEHVVPFAHDEMDTWRNSFSGLKYQLPGTNLLLHGGVDDIWQDTITGQLIVVDYKSQCTANPVIPDHYFNATYRWGYQVQMDFYGYLLTKMGFNVAPVSYFLVVNADQNAPSFEGKMLFDEVLVPYKWQYEWLEPKLFEMVETLNGESLPASNFACENCAYSRERAIMEKGLG